jgi:hypothetical protein
MRRRVRSGMYGSVAEGAPGREMGRAVRVAAMVLTVVALPVGCSSASEPDVTLPPRAEATGSSAPTSAPTPTLSKTDQDLANAKKTYLDFVAVSNQVLQAGMEGWEDKVMPFVNGSVRPSMGSFYHDAAQKGWRQIGEMKIPSIVPVSQEAHPTDGGYRQVVFRVCIDNTDVSYVDANGAPAPYGNDEVKRTMMDMTMVRDQDGFWTLNEADVAKDGPQTC